MWKKSSICKSFLHSLTIAAMAFFCFSTHASVILYGTRVVFPADQAEVTLKMSNTGTGPALVQAWLDNGDQPDAPGATEVPFVVAPSLTRLEPKGQQTLRILHSGQALPADRESLFWINVLDIPPEAKSQEGSSGALALAFNTRIKLMYRPKGLPGQAQDAPEQLQWSLDASDSANIVLRARNASAFVANLGHISLKADGKSFETGGGYVLPGDTASFALQTAQGEPLAGKSPPGTKVLYTSLDDWGNTKSHEAELAQ